MKFPLSKIALLVGAVVAVPIAAQAQQAASASSAFASAPGRALMAETVKAQAVVSAIDPATRGITLKSAEGKTYDMVAGPEIKNFAQLKVGDKVNVQYLRALSLELKKAGAPTGATGTTSGATTAPAGGKPAAAAGTQVTVLADVTAVDTKTHLVTVKGPKGNTVDLNVKDPKQLAQIKVGDKVEAVYTEALAVSVEAAK